MLKPNQKNEHFSLSSFQDTVLVESYEMIIFVGLK